MNTVWTKEMDSFVKKYYTKIGAVSAAERLGVTKEEVSKRAVLLGATRRKDSDVLSDFDAYELRYKDIKSSVNVGDVLKFQVERLVNGHIIKSMIKKKVVAVCGHYAVLDNGKYKESVTFKDLVELLKTS